MTTHPPFEIFLAVAPGLESVLASEARTAGFKSVKAIVGGVTMLGGWPDVWRANLILRGPSRVIARMASFRALHLAQLDKRARRVNWGDVLRADMPFRVEASCSKSRIYHSGAAAERVRRAISEELGALFDDETGVTIRVRIENDVVSIGVDTSGDLLHKRGHKEAVNAAPMRENLAALFLRKCGFDGTQPIVDPMCGSGTFVIEAAEMAAGLMPGRSRHFAFEKLATFDAQAWETMRDTGRNATLSSRFSGSDRDAGAIRMSRDNAKRAGVDGVVVFEQCLVSELSAPDWPPGLVIVNPPYGERIGDRAKLHGLYRALGQTLLTRFKGWRVGLITSDASLARATGLAFDKPFGPVAHGGLKVWLWQAKIA